MTRTFYPQIQARNEFYLPVGHEHQLWVAEYGNPKGLPVVFLHGGPGSGCEDYHPRFFDPQRYRIILFDQRGAGRSKPHAATENNTTADLIADIEQLRLELNIDQWVVFGGSWGSTLGLAYAEQYPEKVLGLLLRGVFLCRKRDIQWFYQDGASAIFPEYWQDYQSFIPEAERDDMVSAYYQRLMSEDPELQLEAAKRWSIWEGRTSTLRPKETVIDHFGDAHTALSLARIECHYFMHDAYLEPDQLLRDADRLADIPGAIVHGRYDVVCPVEQAYILHQRWPKAELIIAPNSGHSATEDEMVDALIRSTDRLADELA